MENIRQRLGLLIVYGLPLALIFGPEFLGVDSPQTLVVQSVAKTGPSFPTYRPSLRASIALKLAQVAVLYFAVLVAVVRFVHDSQKIAYENDRLLFVLPPLSLLLVSISAALAILTLLDVSPDESLIASLGTMGTAFFLSFLATVAGGLGRVQDTSPSSNESVARLPSLNQSKVLAPVHTTERKRDGGPEQSGSPSTETNPKETAEPKDP